MRFARSTPSLRAKRLDNEPIETLCWANFSFKSGTHALVLYEQAFASDLSATFLQPEAVRST
jgi:hypothetical protein